MKSTDVIAYAYEGNIYCPDCLRKQRHVTHHPAHPTFCGAEVDTPQHCTDCGAFLDGFVLTNDGIAYVIEALQEWYGEAKTFSDLADKAFLANWRGMLPDTTSDPDDDTALAVFDAIWRLHSASTQPQ